MKKIVAALAALGLLLVGCTTGEVDDCGSQQPPLSEVFNEDLTIKGGQTSQSPSGNTLDEYLEYMKGNTP